jgi:hypothetical protein
MAFNGMKIQSISEDPTRASRYLADKLTEAEREAYENRFLQDPEAVAEIEATARLKIGLSRLRESGELAELVGGAGATHPNRTYLVALAASVVAVVISLSLWFPRSTSAPTFPLLASVASAFKDHSGHSLAVVSTTPLMRTRAESYDAVIELPKTRGAIRLRVLPSTSSPGTRYDASLLRIREDDTTEKAVSIGDLQPSAEDGFVDMYADSSLLAPGKYQLILAPRVAGAAAGESDTFVIKVAAGVHDQR